MHGETFVFEGEPKTPLLIPWPGHKTHGKSCNERVCSSGFYPTLLEMVGLPLRPQQHIDGMSLVPFLNWESCINAPKK